MLCKELAAPNCFPELLHGMHPEFLPCFCYLQIQVMGLSQAYCSEWELDWKNLTFWCCKELKEAVLCSHTLYCEML